MTKITGVPNVKKVGAEQPPSAVCGAFTRLRRLAVTYTVPAPALAELKAARPCSRERPTDRAEIGVRRDHDAVLIEGSCQDFLVFRRSHSVHSDVDRVMSRRPEKVGQARRQCIVDEKPQAECGRGISRSIAEAAAKRKHSRTSSAWRSGYSERISLSVSPPASSRSTVAAGIRR